LRFGLLYKAEIALVAEPYNPDDYQDLPELIGPLNTALLNYLSAYW
jgi:hypothetical protein